MGSMFAGATLFNGNISNWDTSNVTNMSYMFFNAPSFNKDLNWNVSNVENMYAMFADATSFNGNISNWNTSKVTTMRSLFFNASSFNQDLSIWNVTLVFYCGSFRQDATNYILPIPNFINCNPN